MVARNGSDLSGSDTGQGHAFSHSVGSLVSDFHSFRDSNARVMRGVQSISSGDDKFGKVDGGAGSEDLDFDGNNMPAQPCNQSDSEASGTA